MHRDPHAADEPPVGCSFQSSDGWLSALASHVKKVNNLNLLSKVESGINALLMLQQLTKSSSDRTGSFLSNHLHSERARDMSALLHLFKLLPDRDRTAAACVCKVAEEQLDCLLAHFDFVTL